MLGSHRAKCTPLLPPAKLSATWIKDKGKEGEEGSVNERVGGVNTRLTWETLCVKEEPLGPFREEKEEGKEWED